MSAQPLPPQISSQLSLDEGLRAAYSLYEARQYGQVEALCAAILRQVPRQFDALYLIALVAAHLGRQAEAERTLAAALQVRPDVATCDLMAGLLRQQGKASWINLQHSRLDEYRRATSIDAFILSYPKCGRTWVRLMLGRYLLRGEAGDPLKLFDITRRNPALPTIEVSHDDYPHWKPYTSLHMDKAMYRGKTVIFLVRDPRDVLVSYYFQYTRRGDRELANDSGFRGTLSEFIRHPIGGLRSLVGFYNIWARQRTVPATFHLLRYEELRADPAGAFSKLLRLLGLPDYGAAAIQDALDFGRFENMRRLEETGALGNVRLRPPADGDPEGFKVRRGIVGGYRDYLSEEDLRHIDAVLSAELDNLFAVYKRPVVA
jgi:hypothetical protein